MENAKDEARKIVQCLLGCGTRAANNVIDQLETHQIADVVVEFENGNRQQVVSILTNSTKHSTENTSSPEPENTIDETPEVEIDEPDDDKAE